MALVDLSMHATNATLQAPDSLTRVTQHCTSTWTFSSLVRPQCFGSPVNIPKQPKRNNKRAHKDFRKAEGAHEDPKNTKEMPKTSPGEPHGNPTRQGHNASEIYSAFSGVSPLSYVERSGETPDEGKETGQSIGEGASTFNKIMSRRTSGNVPQCIQIHHEYPQHLKEVDQNSGLTQGYQPMHRHYA